MTVAITVYDIFMNSPSMHYDFTSFSAQRVRQLMMGTRKPRAVCKLASCSLSAARGFNTIEVCNHLVRQFSAFASLPFYQTRLQT
jgi:hypothetical protein